jgi:hypothetical protein
LAIEFRDDKPIPSGKTIKTVLAACGIVAVEVQRKAGEVGARSQTVDSRDFRTALAKLVDTDDKHQFPADGEKPDCVAQKGIGDE